MSLHVEYHKFRRDEKCTEEGCRSRKYYIEDGKKFCQRGHEQAGFTQTQEDEDDWNAGGKKSRKQREEKQRVHRLLSGREATNLYLQCYQLILWKQCHWLIHEKHYPPELEIVIKDLWGLRVDALLKALNEKHYASASGMFSSTSEDENSQTDGSRARSRSSRRSRGTSSRDHNLPKLRETLALCYLAMLLLRLPVSLGEIWSWVLYEEIIYSRAITEIPKDMRSRLPQHYHAALEIHTYTQESRLHGRVLELVEFYHAQFDMVFPPLNYQPLIYKHVKDLGLPVEIYAGTCQMATMLNCDFSYPLLQKATYDSLAYPEIQIISMIVVATKLCYPFDEIERFPEAESHPTTVTMNWNRWCEIMVLQRAKKLKKGERFQVAEEDVLQMGNKELDDYLNWYQRTWIDDREPKMPQQILDLFPLEDALPEVKEKPNPEEGNQTLKRIHQTLKVQKAIPLEDEGDDDDIKRPGELHRRYRTVDELPENAKCFFELAAERSGISLKELLRSVLLLEFRLERWGVARRGVTQARGTDIDSE